MSPQNHSRRWWILALLGMAQLMVVLDATIVNIALPSAQSALGFTDDNRQWIVTAYALTFGSLLLLGGRVGDLLGRKPVFVVGLLGFAAASALGGAAQSFEVLVASRALQGAFGALLAPASLSLLTTTFTDPSERGKAFGIYGAIAGGGGALGLLLGGVLTESLSWRWCLYVNLLFALPAAVGAAKLLASQARSTSVRLDIPGTVTASAGVFALVFGFSKAETRGWGDALPLGLLAAGVLLIVAFVLIQQRVAHPLLPLRVLADRNRGGAYLAIGMAGIGMFGVFLFLTYYLQQNLGFSPIQTGLAFLPMIGAVMVSATTSTAVLLPRVGPRPLIPTGMLLAAGGLVLLAGIGLDSTYVGSVLPGIVIMGVGMGLIMAPAMNTATLGVDAADAGVASAMVNVGQQVGGSIGTALLSSLAAGAATGYVDGRTPTPALLAEAAVHSYGTAFWWSAAIFGASALVCALLLRSGAPETVPAGEPVFAH